MNAEHACLVSVKLASAHLERYEIFSLGLIALSTSDQSLMILKRAHGAEDSEAIHYGTLRGGIS